MGYKGVTSRTPRERCVWGRPVYRFGAVLRWLRTDAGLSILAAAEATAYGNYERWESGQTNVGGQYLRTLAEVFHVTDDLHLFLYAWLIDRLSPTPGAASNFISLDDLRHHIRSAPDNVIDLREHKALVVEPGRHIDVALLCLTAEHGDGRAVVLSAVERSELPEREPDVPILVQLYGAVVTSGLASIGRTLLVRGLDGRTTPDVSNIAPALANPDTYRELADVLDMIDTRDNDPIVAFAANLGPEARRFAELLPMLRTQMRNLLGAAGKPADDEAVERLVEKVFAGKTLPILRLMVRGALRGRLVSPDPKLTAELRAMLTRVRRQWRGAALQQTALEVEHAEAADVFAALDALRNRRTA